MNLSLHCLSIWVRCSTTRGPSTCVGCISPPTQDSLVFEGLNFPCQFLQLGLLLLHAFANSWPSPLQGSYLSIAFPKSCLHLAPLPAVVFDVRLQVISSRLRHVFHLRLLSNQILINICFNISKSLQSKCFQISSFTNRRWQLELGLTIDHLNLFHHCTVILLFSKSIFQLLSIILLAF